MSLDANQKFEVLWFQDTRFKSFLESEDVVRDIKALNIVMDGHRNEKGEFAPGILARVDWIEEQVKKLIKSNAKLQAALYVCTGIWIAVKFYFEFIRKP